MSIRSTTPVISFAPDLEGHGDQQPHRRRARAVEHGDQRRALRLEAVQDSDREQDGGAMVFMGVHGLIEALHSDSYRTEGLPFSERSDAMVVASFQYFSTITLTPVGFGDIVPVTPAARLVTGLL
jgi:hypothetical protein